MASFDVIMLPVFRSYEMVELGGRRIRSKAVRDLFTLADYRVPSSRQLTWHACCLDAYHVASGQKSASMQMATYGAVAELPPSSITGWPSTSPGHWGQRH